MLVPRLAKHMVDAWTKLPYPPVPIVVSHSASGSALPKRNPPLLAAWQLTRHLDHVFDAAEFCYESRLATCQGKGGEEPTGPATGYLLQWSSLRGPSVVEAAPRWGRSCAPDELNTAAADELHQYVLRPTNLHLVLLAGRLLPSAVVIVVYLLIGFVAFWPVYPGISQHLFGVVADFAQSVWFLDWVPHALAHGLNPFFSNAMFVPTGVNLAQNTASPLLGLITAPFALVFSPVVRANLLMVLAMPVSATAAFVVLRKWQVWGPAAALGGLIYGFSPYMVGQSLAHVELIFVPLPPFIALTVASILQRRGSPRRLGIQLGLLVAAQYLISPEVLAIVAIFTVVAVACVAIRHPANVPRCASLASGGHRSGGGGRAPGLSRLDDARRTSALHRTHMSGDEPVPQRPAQLCGPGTTAEGLTGDAVARDPPGRSSGATEAGGYIGVPLLILTGIPRLAVPS